MNAEYKEHYKYNTFKHPIFKENGDGKGERYIHQTAKSRNSQNQRFELLSKESLSYFKTCQKRGENVIITSIEADSFLSEKEDNHTSRWFLKEELEDNQNEI